MHNKLLRRFFFKQQSFVVKYTYKLHYCLKKYKRWNVSERSNFFPTFRVWLYEKQLGSLRGISHLPRCCWYVKFILFSFSVYMIKGEACLPRSHLSKRNGMNKNRYEHFSRPGEANIIQTNMYQFKLKRG